MSVILASGSPRRKELMEMLGVEDLKIIPAKGEECPPKGAGPEETVKALSLAKCREVAALSAPGDIVVAADTIVWIDGHILGKPHSEAEAEAMLEELSANTHEVYTGVAVYANGKAQSEAEVTKVHFRSIAPQEISAYVKTGEPMDKAGAYGAQGKGAVFVRGIEGDFFNVMGLPLCLLDSMLKNAGLNLIKER